MARTKILIIIFLTVHFTVCCGQVKIRLFSNMSPESAVFSVIEGNYKVNGFNGETLIVTKGEPVIISRFNGKLAVKIRDASGFECDSVIFTGTTGDDLFSLRINGGLKVRHNYSGDLKCFPDMGTIVMINVCDNERYIAGVVKAEGGSGKYEEYFKTQAVIARTYMYKHLDKHVGDRYNLCDNTHCQAFNGLSYDTLISRAVLETQNLVILARDSTLIVSAFHSNCGGETLSSEDLWLTSKSYLKSVADSYCLSSRNAVWEKRMSMHDFLEIIMKLGYSGKTDDPSTFSFLQKSRLINYSVGQFTIPFSTIRTEMKLRSTFFSIVAEGDSVILKGRGYGHGVGLCQEGAMVMAAKGFNYQQIIDFYYSDVLISDIKNAVVLPQNFPFVGLKTATY